MEGAAGSPEVIDAFTTVHFILIALTALAVIIVLWILVRLRARNRADREAAQARDTVDAAPPPTPIPTVDAPTAPPPPPLADTPIPAAAPLDAAPATVAATEPAAEEPAETTDDLTRMKGVGPKLAAQLAALGYASFARIAALSPAEAEALDAQLGTFKGRLARDRWIEQAGYLARGDITGFEQRFGKL